MFEIECYNEETFKNKYKNRYDESIEIIKKENIDLKEYYFSQYTKFKKSEVVIYINTNNEDTSLSIEWKNGNLFLFEIITD